MEKLEIGQRIEFVKITNSNIGEPHFTKGTYRGVATTVWSDNIYGKDIVCNNGCGEKHAHLNYPDHFEFAGCMIIKSIKV